MKKLEFALKLFLLAGALSTFIVFTGCNGDDEDPDNAAINHLIGVWTITDVQLDAAIEGKSLAEYAIDLLGVSELEAEILASLFEDALMSNFDGTIEFKSDNTYITNTGGEVDDGTWSLNSNGDELTLDEGTIDEQVIDVLILTASALKVSLDQTEFEDIDEDPDTPDVPINMSIELTLSK